jgi:uncharacterized Zn finger protein (UPF0148 family)
LKVGETNLVKMYNERIIEGTIDFSVYHGAIFCPNCGERIATRYTTKIDKKEAYRLMPSAFNKSRVLTINANGHTIITAHKTQKI